ncbi:hypothetical protein ABT56_19085 [Photobacterium aquae]|uniref:Uncharacterized protein n=1 Tax=Photobacterium aquae TaxID=1195763 RepID=A0A0J1GVR0_9GAMM|nr:hypothetical protein [Photobacterium aquae]KLV03534.1 hypothetical protein ABT56_19085 [Photobacterium aquae]
MKIEFEKFIYRGDEVYESFFSGIYLSIVWKQRTVAFVLMHVGDSVVHREFDVMTHDQLSNKLSSLLLVKGVIRQSCYIQYLYGQNDRLIEQHVKLPNNLPSE